ASEDPIMAEAKEALERLSAEPSAQALAEARERAEVYKALYAQAVREEGREEGRQEGREEGRQEGREEGRGALRASVLRLAGTLGVAVDAHRNELESATFERLQAILDHLVLHRTWP